MLVLVIFGALIALIPGAVASRRGRSFFCWWLFGLLLWPVALIVVLVMPDAHRKCPFCAEAVQRSAVVCPHCRHEVGPVGVAA